MSFTIAEHPPRPSGRDSIAAADAVINEIRDLLTECGLPGGRLERRSRRRFAYPHLIRITPVDQDDTAEPLVAPVRDLSLYGVGFYLPTPLPYQRAILTFDRTRVEQVSILTELDWCRFTRFGWYENGGRFVQLVDWPVSDAGVSLSAQGPLPWLPKEACPSPSPAQPFARTLGGVRVDE